MAKRTIRDRRLTGDDNLTNILSGTATTGTGQVEQQDQQGSISGVPKDATAPGAAAPTTTQSAQQQNQQQAQQQQAKIATKAPKQPARSGMFTNIKQYMEKNKPVIEKMGQQAGSQFATTAEKIRQQADIQQKSYQERLRESQEAVESQLTGGQQAIESALQTTPVQTATEVPETQETEVTTPDQPEAEQPATLADYGKAAENLAASTSALDLEEQIKEASKLQRQASGILSDAGRRDLLRDVFGRGTRQYTSGSQALDNLLLAASPEAGKRLKETVTSASRGLEDIARQQQAGTQAFQELQKQAAGVGGILGRQSEQALQQQLQGASGSKGGYLQQRSDILGDIIAGANKHFQDVYKNIQSQYIDKDRYLTQRSEGPDTISYRFDEKLYDRLSLDKMGYDKAKFNEIIKKYKPKSLYKYKSTESDYLYNDDPGHDESIWVSGKTRRKQNNAVERFKTEIEKYLAEGMSPEMQKVDGLEINPYALSAINRYLTGQGQASLSDLLAGSDIDPEKFYGFSAENVARINALKKLRGEAEVVPSENYFRLEDLQNLLGNKGGYELQNLYDDILYPYLYPDRPRS